MTVWLFSRLRRSAQVPSRDLGWMSERWQAEPTRLTPTVAGRPPSLERSVSAVSGVRSAVARASHPPRQCPVPVSRSDQSLWRPSTDAWFARLSVRSYHVAHSCAASDKLLFRSMSCAFSRSTRPSISVNWSTVVEPAAAGPGGHTPRTCTISTSSRSGEHGFASTVHPATTAALAFSRSPAPISPSTGIRLVATRALRRRQNSTPAPPVSAEQSVRTMSGARSMAFAIPCSVLSACSTSKPTATVHAAYSRWRMACGSTINRRGGTGSSETITKAHCGSVEGPSVPIRAPGENPVRPGGPGNSARTITGMGAVRLSDFSWSTVSPSQS